MSNSKNNPGPPPPPPDDFAKTTPNIKLPDDVAGGSDNEWDRTDRSFPRQPPSDDWGNTVTNLRPIDTGAQDFNKTNYPEADVPKSPDWGVTRPNINKADIDFGTGGGEQGGGYEKTTPYFKLPEAERAKYQDLPPTPTQQAAIEKQELEERGGIPGWVWISSGLVLVFFFSLLVLGVVAFFVTRDTSFSVKVQSAPAGSDILVDGTPWGVTDPSGSRLLTNLTEGTRKIEIVHPSWECESNDVKGVAGTEHKPVIASCKEKKLAAGEDCTLIRPGEEDKAERCYNAALDGLSNPFTVEDLVRALNILYINFDSGKFDVPPKRQQALIKGAGFINQLPPAVVLEIGGHTDSDGSDAANQVLSENRAKAVKDFLVAQGVRNEVLQTRGYGESQPKQDNSTDFGKFQNRRIQYSIVK